MGAGFELMLATDIRIASQDAVFQLPEVQHGFVPAGGTLVRLVRQIGYAHAMEIMLTAERFSALDMRERGIVNRIEPFDRVEATAIDMARRLAGFSPTAVQAIKEAALTLPDLPIVDAFREEAGIGQRTFTSDEARKSLAAFAARGKDS
jgi:enoyl-CoA hydratase